MELKDTIELMNSSDYKNRFKAEFYQVKIRYRKLYEIITKYKEGTLKFNLSCPIELLHEQLHAMKRYMADLENIAEIEKIKL